jgi:hypothetical protein
VQLVDRQQRRRAVPSDEELECGRCLYTLLSGTVVTSDGERGRTTVLWAVAQCSLVQTDHDHREPFIFIFCPYGGRRFL